MSLDFFQVFIEDDSSVWLFTKSEWISILDFPLLKLVNLWILVIYVDQRDGCEGQSGGYE